MRKLGAVSVLFVVACGSSPESSSSSSARPPLSTAEPVASPVAGKLVDTSKDEVDEVTMRYTGTRVPLAELPMVADNIGLPASGSADFSIDIVVPKVKGTRDYSRASGRIELACTKCQIGDDVAKLQLAPKNERAKGFAGDGIPFGHIAIDRFEATLEISGGMLEVTSWKVSSPDLDIQAKLAVTLVQSLEASALAGCLRFKPTETLAKRDARTHGVMMTTGAQRGEDGFHQIALGGTVGAVRKLARECTTSL